MIENLKFIENHGINSFIDREFKKWTCPECGSLFCVHRDRCQTCGHVNKKYPQKNEKGND